MRKCHLLLIKVDDSHEDHDVVTVERLYTGNQYSHMKRFANHLTSKGLDVEIIRDPKPPKKVTVGHQP